MQFPEMKVTAVVSDTPVYMPRVDIYVDDLGVHASKQLTYSWWDPTGFIAESRQTLVQAVVGDRSASALTL